MAEERTEPILFTQYLRPDGRQRTAIFQASPDISRKGRWLIGHGYSLGVEELTTGEVSMTVDAPDTGNCISIELCKNGPEVIAAVERLISSAYEQAFYEEKT